MKSSLFLFLLAAATLTGAQAQAVENPILTKTCRVPMTREIFVLDEHPELGGSLEGGPAIKPVLIPLGTADVTISVDPIANTCAASVSFLQEGKSSPLAADFSCAVTRDSLRPFNNIILAAEGETDKPVFVGANGLSASMYVKVLGLKWVTGLHEVMNPDSQQPDSYNVDFFIAGFNGEARGGFTFGLGSDLKPAPNSPGSSCN